MKLSNFVSGGINYNQKKCLVIGTSRVSNYVKTFMAQFENTFIYPYLTETFSVATLTLFCSFRMEQKKQLLYLIEKLNACHSLIWLYTFRERHRISQSHRLWKGRKISFQLQSVVEPLIEETFKTTNRLILNLCRSVYLLASPFTWKRFARKKQNSTSNCSYIEVVNPNLLITNLKSLLLVDKESFSKLTTN